METQAAAATPGQPRQNAARDYIVDMVTQLAKMARGIGDTEMAIHLNAVAEAARQKDRRR